MPKHSNSKGSWSFRVLVTLTILIVITATVAVYLDRIASFAINNFTELKIGYDKWGNGPFNKSNIYGLLVKLPDNELTIKAEQANLNLHFSDLLKERKLVIDLDMEQVSFPTDELIQSQGENTNASQNFLAIPFGPQQTYGDLTLTLEMSMTEIKVTGFKADSKTVKMNGSYTFYRNDDKVDLSLTISFSPELFSPAQKEAGIIGLTRDNNGWYSTAINYKGNPVFLRALYSFSGA
ncbi:hypothetical protein ACFL5E_01110 [Candidatus Omnitrophota bacterium]